MNRLAAPLYLIAVLVLGALLAALWLAPGPLAALRHWQAPAPQAPNLDDVHAALLHAHPGAAADYPELLQRPLFSATRRPPAPPAPPVAKPQPEPEPEPNPIEHVRVLGVITGPTLNGALLAEGEGTRFLPLNQKYEGWTLRTLAEDHVVFQFRGRRQRLDVALAHLGDAAQPPKPQDLGGARMGVWPRAEPAPPLPDASDAEADDDSSEATESPAEAQPAAPARGGFGGGGSRRPARTPPSS